MFKNNNILTDLLSTLYFLLGGSRHYMQRMSLVRHVLSHGMPLENLAGVAEQPISKYAKISVFGWKKT